MPFKMKELNINKVRAVKRNKRFKIEELISGKIIQNLKCREIKEKREDHKTIKEDKIDTKRDNTFKEIIENIMVKKNSKNIIINHEKKEFVRDKATNRKATTNTENIDISTNNGEIRKVTINNSIKNDENKGRIEMKTPRK